MTSSRILLVDDHGKFLDTLQSLLEIHRDLRVIAKAGDGDEAVRLATTIKPDLVIMDIRMPHMNGIDATRQIVEQDPEAKVLCQSMHVERQLVMKALEAGALGYLVKSCPFDEFHFAVREVLAGRAYLSSGIIGDAVPIPKYQTGGGGDSLEPATNSRQREVLQLLGEGRSSKEVSDQLGVRIETVHKTHREHIMKRLVDNARKEFTGQAAWGDPRASERSRDD